MGRFFSGPPETVIIGGNEYKINTDFRTWLEIGHLLTDTKCSQSVNIAKCLALAYPILPPNPGRALEELLVFYSAGAKVSVSSAALPDVPLFDIEADSGYIYGSFLSQYGIDLFEAELHWWKFRSLLACLDSECKFSKVISYRSYDTHSIKDSGQRHFYERMKRMYALPDNRTDEEKEQAAAESMSLLF